MTEARSSIERQLWTAAVAALGTSLLWLTGVVLVLVYREHAGQLSAFATVARALVRTAMVLAHHSGPIIPAALIAGGILILVVRALVHSGPLERTVRHA